MDFTTDGTDLTALVFPQGGAYTHFVGKKTIELQSPFLGHPNCEMVTLGPRGLTDIRC